MKISLIHAIIATLTCSVQARLFPRSELIARGLTDDVTSLPHRAKELDLQGTRRLTCVDTDGLTTDIYGASCVDTDLINCEGTFDDEDFSALDMCCYCGGGGDGTHAPTTTPSPSLAPTTLAPTVTSAPVPAPTISAAPTRAPLLRCDFDDGQCGFGAPHDVLKWTRNGNETGSSGTGPERDHTSGDSGRSGFYMYVESSDTYGTGPFTLESPPFAECIGAVTFWYHMYGTGMGTLQLGETTDGNTYTIIWSKSGDQGNSWQRATVETSSFVRQVAFLGTTSELLQIWTSDMAIDDVSIFPAANCTLPTPLPTTTRAPTILATPHPTPSPSNVTTFAELKKAITAGADINVATHGTVLVNETLEIKGIVVTIRSTMSATLSGGAKTRILLVSQGGDLTLIGLTLTDGMGENYGGAVWLVVWGSVNVFESTFRNNTAVYPFNECCGHGGAIATSSHITDHGLLRVTLVNSTFVANTIQEGSGAALQIVKGSALEISGCLFANNSAKYVGAINNQGNSSMYISDSVRDMRKESPVHTRTH